MHAWIPFTLIGHFANQLIESWTYEIIKFLVTPNEGTYNCLKGKLHILISYLTIIKEVSKTLEDIFDFAHLVPFDEEHFQDEHCIDIYSTLISIYFIYIIFSQIYMVIVSFVYINYGNNCFPKRYTIHYQCKK